MLKLLVVALAPFATAQLPTNGNAGSLTLPTGGFDCQSLCTKFQTNLGADCASRCAQFTHNTAATVQQPDLGAANVPVSHDGVSCARQCLADARTAAAANAGTAPAGGFAARFNVQGVIDCLTTTCGKEIPAELSTKVQAALSNAQTAVDNAKAAAQNVLDAAKKARADFPAKCASTCEANKPKIEAAVDKALANTDLSTLQKCFTDATTAADKAACFPKAASFTPPQFDQAGVTCVTDCAKTATAGGFSLTALSGCASQCPTAAGVTGNACFACLSGGDATTGANFLTRFQSCKDSCNIPDIALPTNAPVVPQLPTGCTTCLQNQVANPTNALATCANACPNLPNLIPTGGNTGTTGGLPDLKALICRVVPTAEGCTRKRQEPAAPAVDCAAICAKASTFAFDAPCAAIDKIKAALPAATFELPAGLCNRKRDATVSVTAAVSGEQVPDLTLTCAANGAANLREIDPDYVAPPPPPADPNHPADPNTPVDPKKPIMDVDSSTATLTLSVAALIAVVFAM